MSHYFIHVVNNKNKVPIDALYFTYIIGLNFSPLWSRSLDPILIPIILIPVFISLLMKYCPLKWDISWSEWGVQFLIGMAILSGVWAVGRYANTNDVEVLNGAVIDKREWTFRCPTNTMNPCTNGYDCNCVTICTPTYDSKGNVSGQSCTTTCDRCYRYAWERNWYVKSNIDKEYQISRVDAQGANMPKRWADTQIGDPVSATSSFKNWVKAASNSLFRDSKSNADTFLERGMLPPYPNKIYDYYKINRVLTPNMRMGRVKEWNDELNKELSVLGPKKEMNAIFVFVKGTDRNYAHALRYHWNGFKQNDAVVTIGINDSNSVSWVEVMSWSKHSIFDIKARQVFEPYVGKPLAEMEPKTIVSEFGKAANLYFVRRPMEEFEYLKSDIKPSKALIWISVIMAIAIGFITSYVFHNVDLDNAFRRNRSGRYYR